MTRGHEAAVREVEAWLRARVPHAIVVSGPTRVGKMTLAFDLAAALLCDGAAGDARPCRACRGCRRVASGNHPDLHVLRPEGAGGQVRIGDPKDPEPGTVRHLIGELALLPAEASVRIGIVESADRMNEDAQNALLRTLEEPPAGTVIVLCADDEDRLLPTIRSRCVRVRLGPVGPRAIEELLASRGLADAPTAARLARLSGGRPGLAIALARDPESVRAAAELRRRLIDLADAGPGARLGASASLLGEAKTIARGAAEPGGPPDEAQDPVRQGVRSRGAGGGRGRAAAGGGEAATRTAEDGDAARGKAALGGVDPEEAVAEGPARREPASERRGVARALVDTWRVVARDLAVAGVGGRRELRDPALLEETCALAERLPAGAMAAFLERLDAVERLVEANAGPELAIDTLLLAWPRPATPRQAPPHAGGPPAVPAR